MAGREDDKTAERRVRDTLDELSERPRLGERLLARIGARAWERPNVAISHRLYKKYRVLDPWDPDAKEEDELPISLGPVSLRLSEDRRQPAPHLTPKETAKAAAAPRQPMLPSSSASSPGGGEGEGGEKSIWPPGFRPPRGVPQAKPKTDRPPPPPPRPPAPGQVAPKLAPLPIRPDMADQLEAQKVDRQATADSRSARTRLGPTASPMPSRRPGSSVNPNLPGSSDSGGGGGGTGGGGGGPAVDRRPPMPLSAMPKGRAGRLSMRSTPVTAPVITEVEELPPAPEPPAPLVEPEVTVLVPEPEPAPPPAPRSPPQRAARPAAADSLDDLFGFAAQEGRMRLGRKKKEE